MNEFIIGVLVGLIVATGFWWAILRTVTKSTKWMGEGKS